MAESKEAPGVRGNESAGHLSVHVEGAHPVEVPFLFEQPGEAHVARRFAGFLGVHVVLTGFRSSRVQLGTKRDHGGLVA